MKKVKDCVSNYCEIIEEVKSPSSKIYLEFALIIRLVKCVLQDGLKFLPMPQPIETLYTIRDGGPRITNPKTLAKLKNLKRIVRENKYKVEFEDK